MAPYLSKHKRVGAAISRLVELRGARRAARKKRTCWSKKWLLDREKFSHKRLLEELDADDFKKFLRMEERTFEGLVELVWPHIQKQVLRKNEWQTISRQFEDKWNFNHCVGSIDGKHVAIQKPPESGSTFYNYKRFFSIVLFGVVNADYEFIYVNVATNGAASDSTIFNETTLCKKLVEGQLNLPEDSPLPGGETAVPYMFIGDSAFGLNRHLMKPFRFKNITYDKHIFN